MKNIWVFAAFLGLIFVLQSKGFAEEVITPDQLKVEDVICTGNERTQCDLIKSELRLSPGDQVDEAEIRSGKIRIGLLGLFKEVDISLKKGSQRGMEF